MCSKAEEWPEVVSKHPLQALIPFSNNLESHVWPEGLSHIEENLIRMQITIQYSEVVIMRLTLSNSLTPHKLLLLLDMFAVFVCTLLAIAIESFFKNESFHAVFRIEKFMECNNINIFSEYL